LSEQLRVLIVEDSENDALITVRALQRGGYAPAYERVETEDAMSAALDRGPWDIIIADYSMPQFSGLEALRLLQRSGMDTPFILVSGTVGEETAVAALKAGAHDYLVKGNLTRLVPAVKRELRDAEMRRERGQSGKALREATELLQAVVEFSPVAIVILDTEGNVQRWNPAAQRMFGWSERQVLGRPLRTVPEGKAEEHRELREAVLRGETFDGVHVQRVRKGGRRLDISLSTAALRDAEGNVCGVVGMMVDVTERMRVEEELLQRQELLSTILEGIGDAVIATDAGGIVKFLNPAAQQLTAWSKEDAVGRPFAEVVQLLDEETGLPMDDPVAAVIEAGGVVRIGRACLLVGKQGGRTPVEDSCAPIRDSAGNAVGVVLVLHDIGLQKHAADELRRLTTRLLGVQEEERRQVAYDIHDGLGQLITASSMHLETFCANRETGQQAVLDEELAKTRRCLQDAVVEMRRMVSHLGPLLLEDLGLVEASRKLLSDLAERVGWETEFESHLDDDRLHPTAETAVYRIVQEALSNAAKHAAAPKVRLTFERDGGDMIVVVRDWGRGFQVSATPHVEGGHSVGLLGMRERAGLIGGSVTIESELREGTTVTIRVPLALGWALAPDESNGQEEHMNASRNGQDSPRETITILIADDHPMVREGLRSMLDEEGIQIVGEAVNGAEAVDLARRTKPDVILMDVRMPDMDGLAATEIIKQESPETSVIVITSYESKDYLRRAIDAGAAGYLLKGMSRNALIDGIRLVRGGGSLIDARLLSEMLSDMGVEGTRFQGAEGTLEALTPREQEVLHLLVGGLTNKEIAAEMHYSVGTVKNVVQRVIEKLGVSDRTQAAVFAVRAGMSAQV
jgi:PAS domain S-box-containing protein